MTSMLCLHLLQHAELYRCVVGMDRMTDR